MTDFLYVEAEWPRIISHRNRIADSLAKLGLSRSEILYAVIEAAIRSGIDPSPKQQAGRRLQI